MNNGRTQRRHSTRNNHAHTAKTLHQDLSGQKGESVMKSGTLRCLLFGHKFIAWTACYNPHHLFDCEQKRVTDYCVRCGKDKDDRS